MKIKYHYYFINMNSNYSLKSSVSDLLKQLKKLSIDESFKLLVNTFPGTVTFSTSFSLEDQVITHAILSQNLPVSIFTLDTGRLFSETYSVWSRTNEKYKARIKAYYPDNSLIENYLNVKGPNAFYESVENRKECCHIRKVEPLKRALKGNSLWITGLRSEHSSSRNNLELLEWDEANNVLKYHPLLHWTTKEVSEYIFKFNIPYNSLHSQGFVSIGCAPCTRAVNSGEDFRAGRWWWEDSSKKECGLHTKSEMPGKNS